MKRIIIVLCLLQTAGCAQTPCPPHGSAKPGTLQYVTNPKKNRTDIPTSYKKISINEWLALPDDSTGDGTAYQLAGGYVIKVKHMDPESCNCKSKTERDYHIEVVPSPDDAGDVAKYVIVEVSPRMVNKLKWKEKDILLLKNHYVDFYGFKFADLEHQNMSLKSHPYQKKAWRGTINEIHPITKWVVKN